jgi:C-terminal processing protease CtpA/Prc
MHPCQHIALCGLVSGLAFFPPQLSAGPEEGTPAADQQEFSTLFAQLGSDSFRIRQDAQQKLQKAASSNRDLILEQSLNKYFQAEDPEVRYRLRAAMFGIVGATLRKEGFIGIRMMDAPVQFLNNGGNAQPERAVQILSVVPDTAASKAGLRPGDKIMRLDGKAFDNKFPAYFELSKYIRSKTSGDAVKLSLKRGLQDIEIELLLGARPEGIDGDRRALAFSEWMNKQKIARGIIEPEPEAGQDLEQVPSRNNFPLPGSRLPQVPEQNPNERK